VSTALVAATPKTAAQVLAPANQRVKVLGYGFYLDGVTSNAVPVELRIQRQSTAGTGTGITVGDDESELTETVQSTATGNFTVEPTAGQVLRVISIPAFMGQYEVPLPAGQEIIIPGGGRLGFTFNAPAGVNVRGYLKCEE
jgi:hypothetical protein